MQAIAFTPTSTAVVSVSSAAAETVASSNTSPDNTVASSNTSTTPNNLNEPTIQQTVPTSANTNLPPLIAELDTLCAKREEWELNAYKRSNEQLYEILSRCLYIYQKLSDDFKQRKLFRLICDELKKSKVITFNDGTHLTTRIVRYVFRSCNKRSFAYAKAIAVAHAANVKPTDLPRWLTEQGGVEQVRRSATNGISPSQQAENMRFYAADALADSNPIIGGIKSESMFEPNTDAEHMFALALLRKEADGTISLVYGTNNSSLINKFLAFAGKEMSAEKSNTKKTKKRSENNAQRDAVVNAA